MLVFKAWRKSPALTQETTPSQRRITRILSDAQQAAAAEFSTQLSFVADALSRGQVERVVSVLPTEPWLKAQEELAAELLGELLDAGSRVTLPSIEKATLSYSFDRERPESSQWARQAAGTMISQITGEQRNVVREVVSSAALGVGDWGDVARRVQGSIGLTTQQAGWVANHYDRAYLTAIRGGMGTAQAAARARDSANRYQTAVHRYRANTIARTETMRAASEGRMQAWNQGITEGFIGANWQKEWIPESDACEICLGLRGKRIRVKDSFSVGEPPAHPNCRCDVILVPPKVQPAGAGVDWGTALTTVSTLDDLATLAQIGRYSVEQLHGWRQAYQIATESGDRRSFGEWFEDVIEPDITAYADEGRGEESEPEWTDLFNPNIDDDAKKDRDRLLVRLESEIGEIYQDAFQNLDWSELGDFDEIEDFPSVSALAVWRGTNIGDQFLGELALSVKGTQGSNFIFGAERSFNFLTKTVYHRYFSVVPLFQGQGFAQQVHDSLMDLYRRRGMERVKVQANIDVGGYTWAKFGFDWAQREGEPYVGGATHDRAQYELRRRSEIIALRAQIARFLGSIQRRADASSAALVDRQIAAYMDILDTRPVEEWPTPAELAAIGWTEGAQTWAGKEGMLKTTWDGVYYL